MKVNDYLFLTKLRVLVGYLGEKEQNNWWASAFFSKSSAIFLMPVFGKTSFLAQTQGAKEAATLIHDEHIGVGRVYHLFRLPEAMEEDLHRILHEPQVVAELSPLLNDKETAQRALAGLAGSSIWTGEGPLRVGEVDDLSRKMPWQDVAYHYANAFEKASKVFPFFSGK